MTWLDSILMFWFGMEWLGLAGDVMALENPGGLLTTFLGLKLMS